MGLHTQAVQQLYVVYFNRPADPVGLAYWESVLASTNGDRSALLAAIPRSAEFTSAFAGLSLSGIVKQIYVNVLGRQAESSGLDYWVQQLESGAVSLASLVAAVAAGAQGSDAVTYENKVAAATLFTNFLSTMDQAQAYDGASAAALAQDFLSKVTDAGSLAAAITPDNLLKLLDAMVGASPVPGTQYLLTRGVDNIVGSTANDTFVAGLRDHDATLTDFDTLDGGAGTDTLNIAVTGKGQSQPSTLTVRNIERVTVGADEAFSLNTSNWAGVSNLSITSRDGATINASTGTAVTVTENNTTGAAAISVVGGAISIASTNSISGGSLSATTLGSGNVSVASTSSVASGAASDIKVSGGSTVNVIQQLSPSAGAGVSNGAVNITGTAVTTSVSVTNTAARGGSSAGAAVLANSVTITDYNAGSSTGNGAIASVSLANFTNATLHDNALAKLSLSGGSGNVTIANGGRTTPSTLALALALDGQSGGTLSDAGVYTTLNINTSGRPSSLAGLVAPALTSLTVGGTQNLAIGSASLAALTKVTTAGAAGLSINLTGTALTAMDTTASTGNNSVSLDGSKASYKGGNGADLLTLSSASLTHAFSLGGGDDTLNYALGTALPTAAVDGGAGTDTLVLNATLAQTASANAALAATATNFEQLVLTAATTQTVDLAMLGNFTHVTASAGKGLTLNNLPSNGTLVLSGPGTAYTLADAAYAKGTADLINLRLTDGSGAGVNFASTGITAAGVEGFAIVTADTSASPAGVQDIVTLLDSAVTTLSVTGNAGLHLVATSTALTSVDASGISLGGFTFTSGALASAVLVKGAAGGTNTVDLSAATVAAAYSGSSSVENITISNALANRITLGSGTNTVTVGAGSNTIVAASGSGEDRVNLVVTANVNTFTTITDGHDRLALGFSNHGTERFTTGMVSLSSGTLASYANAVVAAAGNASADGVFGWFHYDGDTYIVESRHNGSTTPTFVNGTDMIVKLTGLLDLSKSTVDATANTLTISH